MKLTISQSTLLRLIAETPAGLWCPRESTVFVESTCLILGGSAVAQTTKALWRLGLAKPHTKLGPYASWITDEGRRMAEAEKGKPLAWVSTINQPLNTRRRKEQKS